MIACFLFTKKDRLRVFRFVRLHCLSFLFYPDRAPRTIYAMKLKVHTVLSAVMEQRTWENRYGSGILFENRELVLGYQSYYTIHAIQYKHLKHVQYWSSQYKQTLITLWFNTHSTELKAHFPGISLNVHACLISV